MKGTFSRLLVLAGVVLSVLFARKAFALGVTGGDVPLPVVSVGGKTQLSWTGSYAELLEADALAMCWTTQQDPFMGLLPAFEADLVANVLTSRMSAASCKTSCSTPPVIDGSPICRPVDLWMASRQDATCNVDASSGVPRALDVHTLRSPSATASYVLPSTAALGMSGASADATRKNARNELAYADLALCMAEQLRAKIDTVQVAFASGDDLAQVQAMVQERALTAVYEYSVITKALASPGAPPVAFNGSDQFYVAPFALWGRSNLNNSAFSDIGDDFQAAIGLLIEATRAESDLLLRSSAAAHGFGTITNFLVDNYDQGMVGPRSDLLDLIYGPGDITMMHPRSMPQPPPSAVVTDMSAPQVGELLRLARAADALDLQWSSQSSESFFWVKDSADSLYVKVENYLRNIECTAGNGAFCGNASGSFNQFILAQRYGIDSENHATALVEALADAAFGPISAATGERTSVFYHYNLRSDMLDMHPFESRPLYLMGNHTLQSASGDRSILHIDKDFWVEPLTAADRQSTRLSATLPVRDVNSHGDAPPQIGLFRFTDQGIGEFGQRTLGTSAVLALARESLVQVGQTATPTGPRSIYAITGAALQQIDKAIGPTQIMIRQALKSTTSSVCAGCVTYQPNYDPASGQFSINVDLLADSTLPRPLQVAVMDYTGWAAPAALSASTKDPFEMPFESDAQSVTGAPYAALVNVGSTLDGRTMMGLSATWNDGMTVLLHSGNSTIPDKESYTHVYSGLGVGYVDSNLGGLISFPVPGLQSTAGIAFTYGGEFNQTIENAWRFDPDHWDTPAYDAFGLPRDWSPAADATLEGDDGVPIERHFLDRAATAAQDATSALQQAFDNLQQEEVDDNTLASAESKAKQLDQLNYQALCGAKVQCQGVVKFRTPTVPECNGDNEGTGYCEQARAQMAKVVGALPLDKVVGDVLDAGTVAPTFSDYSGGQIQGLLLAEWNGWQALVGKLNTGIGAISSAMSDFNDAATEATSAELDYQSAVADSNAVFAQLQAQGANLQQQADQFDSEEAQYKGVLTSAQQAYELDCSEGVFAAAVKAGIGYSNPKGLTYTEVLGSDGLVVGWSSSAFKKDKNITYSTGPFEAAWERCEQARQQYETTSGTVATQLADMADIMTQLQTQADALGPQYAALGPRVSAAGGRIQVAVSKRESAVVARDQAQATALSALQDAVGQVLAASVALDQAYAETDANSTKLSLDAQQTNYDIRTRFGVRQRFQSYDLWRARALTESARRLAVAARRAIESRYVVDLSTLSAPEPFVDSPSLWADDIYDSDLKPPVALGLTTAPATGSGIYTNKLTDYVNNLQSFLDGFAIKRPSADVRSDAEVIEIPGPAQVVNSSANGANYSYIDPTSMGWAFFCSNTSTWIPMPGAATFSREAFVSTLSTACGGSAPTLARLGFSLDPWGRYGGNAVHPPSTARYNLRFGNLALNLVGSGIRDCSKAADPNVCYAEPFLRYGLRQVGPVWVTDYNESWHTLSIPVGNIDDGKALAAEEWLDPVENGFNRSDVNNIARSELRERPVGGDYELTIELTPDVRVERIERIQLLTQIEYWVRQQ